MKIALCKITVGIVLFAGLMLNMMPANAGTTGYMSFLNNAPVEVTTGDAASYMHVGRDWDGATVNGGVAQPTKIQESRIKTYRTPTSLKFEFVIPDRTMTSVAQGNSTLSCGDRVIVQINPNNSSETTLQASGGIATDYRYMVTIKNKTIVDPLGSASAAFNLPTRYIPNQIGLWGSAVPTGATATWNGMPGAGNSYSFTLEIPLSEIGNPASDIGMALAIINDLGHSHGMPAINEITGTAFPSTMGMTSVSDPGLIGCAGAVVSDSTGNWSNPSTWGTGFFSTPQVANVTFDQTPNLNLASSIRLGDCGADWKDINPIPSLSGWDTFQQDPNNRWYVYNPPSASPPPLGEKGPCRMSIWFHPQLQGGGASMTKKRFLVMWAGAGIAPQEWYVAGLTDPVAVVGQNTWVNFIWNALPKAAYTASSHPCLRVYALPEDLTLGTPIPGLTTTADYENFIKTINTQAGLAQMENAYNVPYGNSSMAQMNFSNIGPSGGCPNNKSACFPLEASYRNSNLMVASLDGWSPAPEMLADNRRVELDVRDRIRLPVGDRSRAGDVSNDDVIVRPPRRLPSTLMVFTAFGMAGPQGMKRYVYLEDMGTVAFGANREKINTVLRDFKVGLSNPRFAAMVFVKGKSVEIAAPARNLFVALETQSPRGEPVPVIDRRVLDRRTKERFEPGQMLNEAIDLRRR